MFPCQSCMWRHVQGLLKDSSLHSIGIKHGIVQRQARLAGKRKYGAATAVQKDAAPANIVSQDSHIEGTYTAPNNSAKHEIKALERQKWLQSRGTRPLTKPRQELPDAYETRQALLWLGDPLKLAEHILDVLRKDRFNDAEHLVRAASKNIQCTVSWNHLVDWQMSQGKVNGAIKTYNEMKKRGQAPDAHTYTILFRGLADHPHHPRALSAALSIYHSMDAENCPVQPSVIHTNAVLKVCARADDLDALFGVAAKLRRKGLRAPNNLTFTTILNAIRQHAIGTSKDINPTTASGISCEKAIVDARKIWDDIVSRWRHGDMWIDEELVCSMGRILLLGHRHDVDDIFSLVEQTMNIPRFVPPLGTPERKEIEPSLQGRSKPLNFSINKPLDNEIATGLARYNEFRKVKPPVPSNSLSLYAKPGANSLSLVLQALYVLRMKRSMEEYWDIFTKTHNVKPDSANFHSYLRSLRVHRASQETVELLLQMPASILEKKTFRMTMSTCVRDKNNPAVFAIAGKVLDLMQQTLAELDLPALHSYLEVAIYGALPSTQESVSGSESQYSRGRQILRALERLGPAIVNIRSALAYGEPATSKKEMAQATVTQNAALALIREMISAYDKLINKGLVTREMHEYLIGQRKKLSAYASRYNEKKSKAPGASTKANDGGSGSDIYDHDLRKSNSKSTPLSHDKQQPTIVRIRRNFTSKPSPPLAKSKSSNFV